MIPDSLAALVSFLLLLAPGIVWQLAESQHSPTVKESTLVEVSRVVLASLIATLGSALLLAHNVWIPLYQRVDTAGFQEFSTPSRVMPYAGAVVVTSALACALTFGVARIHWRGRRTIRAGRVWNQILVTHVPLESTAPFLLIELDDGVVWRGILESFDTDPEEQDRGLALGGPLARKRPGGSFELKGDGHRYVILTESRIRSIQVAYPPNPDARLRVSTRDRTIDAVTSIWQRVAR